MPRSDPEFLADVLDALSGFVYVYDLAEERNVYVSKRWADEFGYTAEETAADSGLLARIVHADDLPAVAAHHDALRHAKHDEGRALEYRVHRKDGSVAWVRSLDRPLARDARGVVSRIVGHAHDITSEKTAELASAEGDARFRAIVEHLPDAVFIANGDAEILQVNDAACAQLGYAREELVGMRVPDFVAPEYRSRVPHRLSAPPGSSTAYQSAHLRKDGTEVPVETVVVAVNLGGTPVYMGVARDISDRLRLETQLRDAQRMEAIGRLAAAIAHDFNNILAAILGGASLLEAQLRSDTDRGVAKEIRTAASRGADLTRQLLSLGGRQTPKKEPVELVRVVDDALVMLRRLLGASISVEADVSPECVLLADRGMLVQVVMNLALNARDAMPDGGRLSIRAAPSTRDPGLVEMTLADTGRGIEASDLAQIFEPFFTTKGAGGTGIGLATVKWIVSQHEGRNTVDSSTAGTTFRLELPRTDLAVIDTTSLNAPATTQRLTVLLVDDMQPVRDMVRHLLEAGGHHVLPADSPEAALAIWQEQAAKIDLLLSDITLGAATDGPGLADELRRQRPELKVILMSGLAPEPGKGTAEYAFLQKPFGLAQLNALLQQDA